jgi:hypothetical protein
MSTKGRAQEYKHTHTHTQKNAQTQTQKHRQKKQHIIIDFNLLFDFKQLLIMDQGLQDVRQKRLTLIYK